MSRPVHIEIEADIFQVQDSKKYASDDADHEILSTDNVVFKVHSYRLQSASSVFPLLQ
jgi:hypothetical protein